MVDGGAFVYVIQATSATPEQDFANAVRDLRVQVSKSEFLNHKLA